MKEVLSLEDSVETCSNKIDFINASNRGDIFRKRIYRYCDENVNREVLFTIFTYLWPVSDQIEIPEHTDYSEFLEQYTDRILPLKTENVKPYQIINLATKIIRELQSQKIIKEVENHCEFRFYPLYEILPHESLIKNNGRKL